MKTTRMPELPKCDICQGRDAAYDVPTKSGPWANLCEECFPGHQGRDAERIGSKLVHHVPATPVGGEAQMGLEPSDEEYWYGIVMCSEDRMIGCPQCHMERAVEPDADYEFVCEECGITVQTPEGIL